MADWLEVTLLAAGTALATGVGALPFLIVRNMSARVQALSSAFAAGAMVGASFGLVNEGLGGHNGGNGVGGDWRTIAGVIVGVLFIAAIKRCLPSGDHLSIGRLTSANARRAIIVIGVMTIHSAAEGIGVGVSFGGGEAFGLAITIAIAVHNIPEGIAISAVMVPKGTPVWQAAAWSVFSSLPQPLLALPAFLFITTFGWWLPVGLGFAAGAMIWMAAAELLPEALQGAGTNGAAVSLSIGFAAMIAMQVLIVA